MSVHQRTNQQMHVRKLPDTRERTFQIERAVFGGHTGPGRVPEQTSQTGKTHIYEMFGRVLRNLALAVGKN